VQNPAQRVVLELPGEPGSVSSARAFVRQTLDAWGLSTLVETTSLLVSELATNAVLHARTSYDVVVERDRDSLRVAVLDGSPAGPHRRHHGLRAATGRGLGLVETLAGAWGAAAPEDLGTRAKGVWFELPTDPSLLPATDEGALYGDAWLSHLEDL